MKNRLGYVICETSMGQDLPKMERLTEKQLSNTFTDLPPWAYNKNRVVAQVTFQRANEKNSGKVREPTLSDLRDSGAIEQDADIVLFIHRKLKVKHIYVLSVLFFVAF